MLSLISPIMYSLCNDTVMNAGMKEKSKGEGGERGKRDSKGKI